MKNQRSMPILASAFVSNHQGEGQQQEFVEHRKNLKNQLACFGCRKRAWCLISSDPAEKDGARRAAEKQRILARYFFNDYVQIADRLGVIVPADVAQMSPFIDDNGTQPAL